LAQHINNTPKPTEKFPFVAEVIALYKADQSAREVANELGVSKSHVLRILKKVGIVRSQGIAQDQAAKRRRAAAHKRTVKATRSWLT